MAQRGETDWQINKSVFECNKYMLESGFASDVIFHVNSPDGGTTQIRAHTYMLVSRSPVFEALFFGGFTEPNDGKERHIDIADVEVQAFKEMLKYLYYEQVDITPDSVLPILYAAKKYMLYPLAERCMAFLEDTISSDSVCTILNHSILYDEKDLTEKCIKYIAPRCRKLMQSRGFLDLCPAAVSRILRCDLLYVDSEREVLAAALRWAKERLQNAGRPPTDAELRAQLGDNLFDIRFLSMKADEFARTAGRTAILTDTEKSMMYYYQLTGERSDYLAQLGFNPAPRMQKCVRYKYLGRNLGWWTCNGPGDAISFTVSRSITLLGVSVYGGREPAKHQVSLEVWRNPEVLIKQVDYTLYSDGKDEPFPVYLGDEGADLSPDVPYTVLVIMRGPIVFYGQGGDGEPVTVMGVKFTFSRSERSGNGTNVKSGQIPELLFLPKTAE